MKAAGILLVGPDGRDVFLVQRGALVPEPGTWANPGGHLEPGESWQRAAEREFREEVGLAPRYELLGAIESETPYAHYVLFVGRVDEHELRRVMEKGRLNWESSNACWTPLSQPGVPLHPALAQSWPAVRKLVRGSVRRI